MASSASSSTAQPHASTRTRPARRAASQLRSLTGYRDASDSDGGSLGSNDGDECYAEEDQDVEIAPAFEPDEDEYNADEGVAAASAVRRSAGKQAAKKPKVVASTSKRQSSKKDKGKERETKSQGADDDAKTSSRRQRLLQMRSVEELEEMWEEEQDALAWVTPTYPPRLRALHTVFRPLKPAGKSKRDQVTAAERSGATVNSPEVIGTCEVLECCHAPDERHRLGKQKPAKDFAKSIQGLSRADFGFNSIDGIFTPGTSFVGAKIGLALVHEASTADECREALDLEMIRSRAATTQAAALATPRSEDYEFELLAKWREIVSQGGPVVSLEQKIAALLLLSLADEGYAAEGPDGKLRVSSIETQDEAARMQSNITFSKHSLFGPTIRIASQVIGPLVPSSGVFGKIKQNIWGTDRVVLLSRPFNDSYRFYLVLPKFTSEKYQIVVPPYAGKLLSVPNTPVLQFGSTAPGEANDWHREVDESIALLPPEQVEAAQDARDEILYLMTFIDKHYQEKKPKSKSDGDRINRSIVALAEREMPQWNTSRITAYGLHIYKHGNTVHVNRGALTRKSRRDYTKPERVFSNIATKQLGLILVSIGTKIFLQTKSREKAELVMAALIDTVIFEDIDDTMRPVVRAEDEAMCCDMCSAVSDADELLVVGSAAGLDLILCKTCNELYTQALVPNVKGLVNPLVHLIPKIRSEMFITGDLPPQYKIASNFAQAQQMWAGVSGYRTSVDLATDAYLGGDLTMTGLGYPYPRASLDAVGLLPIPSGDDVMFVKHAIPENTVFTTSPINLMAQARPRSDIVLVSLLIAITTVVGVLERGKGEEAFANANHGRATALLHALHDRLVENRCLILQWSYDVDWPPASGGKSPLKVVADKILDGLGPLETFLAHARAMDQFLDDVLRIRNFGDTALPGSEVWYRNMFEHLRNVPSEQVAEALDALEKNRTARSPVERSTPGRKDLDDPADEERIFNMLLEIERLFEYRFERTEDGFPMMADKAEVEEIKAGGGRVPDKAAVIFNLRVRYWRMLLKCDAKYREDVGAEDEEGLFPCFVVVVFYLIAKYSGRDVYCGRLVWFAPAHPQAAGVGHTVPFQPMLTGRTVPHPTSIDDFDFEACNVALRNFNSTRHVVLSVQGELDTADGDVKRCFFKHLLKYLVRVLGADGVHGWSDDEHKLVSSVVGEVLAAEPEELLAPLKDRGYLPHLGRVASRNYVGAAFLPQTVTLPRETVGTGGVSASAEGGAEAGTSSGATRSGMGQTADEG